MSIMINEQRAGPSSQPDGEPIVPVEHDVAPASPFVLRRRELGNNIRENWHGFRHFMWNMEKREVMGRNGKSWAQIGLFYLCLYVFLAGYFAAMFAIFYQTISQERPKYNTLITPPGLHVFPIPTGQGRIEYGVDNSDVDRMRFEQEIEDNVFARLDIDQSKYENCYDLPPLTINDPQRFCRYDASLLGECAPDNTGYNTMQPCLYMGLNKVWGWIPEGFTSDVLMTQFNKSASFTNRIFFTCDVHEDHQQYVNTLTMFPADGVSFGHYPYVVGTDQALQARYLRPVVALKVDINTRGKEVRIECRARASNIPDEAPGGLFNSREEPSRFTVRVMVRS